MTCELEWRPTLSILVTWHQSFSENFFSTYPPHFVHLNHQCEQQTASHSIMLRSLSVCIHRSVGLWRRSCSLTLVVFLFRRVKWWWFTMQMDPSDNPLLRIRFTYRPQLSPEASWVNLRSIYNMMLKAWWLRIFMGSVDLWWNKRSELRFYSL